MSQVRFPKLQGVSESGFGPCAGQGDVADPHAADAWADYSGSDYLPPPHFPAKIPA